MSLEFDDWLELSDDELQARLENQGVTVEVAQRLVAMRDDEEFAEDLSEFVAVVLPRSEVDRGRL